MSSNLSNLKNDLIFDQDDNEYELNLEINQTNLTNNRNDAFSSLIEEEMKKFEKEIQTSLVNSSQLEKTFKKYEEKKIQTSLDKVSLSSDDMTENSQKSSLIYSLSVLKFELEESRIDGDIELVFDFKRTDTQPVKTSFILHKDQNQIVNYRSELLPNVTFDVNRTFTNDSDTYVTVDVYRKCVKEHNGKLRETEKAITSLKLKLDSTMMSKKCIHNDCENNEICLIAKRVKNK